MNTAIMALLYPEKLKLVQAGKCTICTADIQPEDFRDVLSIKEYRISGMCQGCQDEVFQV